MIEMNDKGSVHIGAQHPFEEAIAGISLGFNESPLTHAGIDEQPKRERQFALSGEVANLLWTTILGQTEIAGFEVGDDPAIFSAHRRKYGDDFDICRKCRALFSLLNVGGRSGVGQAAPVVSRHQVSAILQEFVRTAAERPLLEMPR
jgi:hypothetical protein